MITVQSVSTAERTGIEDGGEGGKKERREQEFEKGLQWTVGSGGRKNKSYHTKRAYIESRIIVHTITHLKTRRGNISPVS